jgi:hypothetical protein
MMMHNAAVDAAALLIQRDPGYAGRKRDYSAMMQDTRCADMCRAAQGMRLVQHAVTCTGPAPHLLFSFACICLALRPRIECIACLLAVVIAGETVTQFDCGAADVAAAAVALAAIGSPNAGATSDRLAALLQWQHTIEAAEAQWGPLHPAVGRAWLELARALQAVDKDSERAKLATKKAFDICQILLKETATVSSLQSLCRLRTAVCG